MAATVGGLLTFRIFRGCTAASCLSWPWPTAGSKNSSLQTEPPKSATALFQCPASTQIRVSMYPAESSVKGSNRPHGSLCINSNSLFSSLLSSSFHSLLSRIKVSSRSSGRGVRGRSGQVRLLKQARKVPQPGRDGTTLLALSQWTKVCLISLQKSQPAPLTFGSSRCATLAHLTNREREALSHNNQEQ